MKLLISLFALTLLVCSAVCSPSYERGCEWLFGKCVKECEEGTHEFTADCGHLTPEATCTNPHPVEDKDGEVCDFSACYCDAPYVREEKSGKCVALEDCPKTTAT